MTPALVREVERDLPASSPAPSTPTLSLSPLERRAVGTLVADAEETMARYTAERAGAYATGRSDVRLRALARAAAREDVMAQELGALLAAAVARRDERGVQILERSLNAATQRYLRIVEQLRVESAPTRRVMMRATGSITVAAEERG